MKKLFITLWLLFPLILLSDNCFSASGEQLVKGTFTATVSNIETVGTINVLSDLLNGTVSLKSPFLNNGIVSSSILGCSSYATITGTSLSNQVLIAPVTGRTLYILGIDVYNRSTTGGRVDFYWDSTGTNLCYPSAIGGAVGNGYIVDVERSRLDGGLYITSVPTSIALVVYYIQQ